MEAEVVVLMEEEEEAMAKELEEVEVGGAPRTF